MSYQCDSLLGFVDLSNDMFFSQLFNKKRGYKISFVLFFSAIVVCNLSKLHLRWVILGKDWVRSLTSDIYGELSRIYNCCISEHIAVRTNTLANVTLNAILTAASFCLHVTREPC
jgi:hypothetical protein